MNSLDLLATLCLMQPRGYWLPLLQMMYCWLMFNFLSTRTPGPVMQTHFQSTLSLSWLFLTRSRTWHFTLLSFMRLLLAHFSSLLKTPWMSTQLSGVSAIPPCFTLSVNLLKLHSVSSPRSLMLKSIGLQYWWHH